MDIIFILSIIAVLAILRDKISLFLYGGKILCV